MKSNRLRLAGAILQGTVHILLAATLGVLSEGLFPGAYVVVSFLLALPCVPLAHYVWYVR